MNSSGIQKNKKERRNVNATTGSKHILSPIVFLLPMWISHDLVTVDPKLIANSKTIPLNLILLNPGLFLC